MLCNPKLIDSLYDWKRDPEELKVLEAIRKSEEEAEKKEIDYSFFMIKNCDDLLIRGLLGSNLDNRKNFKEVL